MARLTVDRPKKMDHQCAEQHGVITVQTVFTVVRGVA